MEFPDRKKGRFLSSDPVTVHALLIMVPYYWSFYFHDQQAIQGDGIAETELYRDLMKQEELYS